MKKNILRIAIVTLVGVLMASCMGPEDPILRPDDPINGNIVGLWLEDSTQHYVRFTTEQADSTYQYGYEWNEEEDVTESDVLKDEHGNGWFKWLLEKPKLTEIHLMNNGGAYIPKIYTITKLTDTKLQYYEKEQPKNKFSFSRMK